METRKTIIRGTIAALLALGALAGCGGGSTDQSQSKLLPQTGCAGAYCYGYDVLSSSQAKFWVKSAPWADLHYTVNGGGQLNVRMAVTNGNNAYTVSGLKSGDTLRYFYTIGNTSGGATDTAWMSFKMGSTTPTPAPTPAPTPTPTPTPTGWTLVWQDEFNGTSLDTGKWNYEVNGNGGGNNELQYYTSRPENVRVSGGNLIIEARRENYGGRAYTSGRINTKGKASWTRGRMEARMKLPTGKGIWPAFWMLGTNIDSVGWPKCGEIDIMEHINTESLIHGTIHWSDAGGNYAQYGGPSFGLDVTQYHVYRVEWDTAAIRWYVDGTKYWEANIANGINGTDEFQRPFFAIFNLAVGGNWPGNPDGSTTFPKQMLVDYVRVYRK